MRAGRDWRGARAQLHLEGRMGQGPRPTEHSPPSRAAPLQGWPALLREPTGSVFLGGSSENLPPPREPGPPPPWRRGREREPDAIKDLAAPWWRSAPEGPGSGGTGRGWRRGSFYQRPCPGVPPQCSRCADGPRGLTPICPTCHFTWQRWCLAYREQLRDAGHARCCPVWYG